MIATSILFANYLVLHRVKSIWIYVYLSVYLTIELSFLFANLDKFSHGGYVPGVNWLLFFGCVGITLYFQVFLCMAAGCTS